ncbi:phosphoglycerate mutase-like protein [Hypoxylon argillaceum]|nr:phosphoglycerate mutase-like protein [Hypoxylon argillaceum]KAI1156133.1 phosphoglycerate mutase-like protein [Nemania diffusa]
MAPIVILIRHAQALHNVDNDWSIFDPKLTDKGIEQCKTLAAQLEARFPYSTDGCRIVVSPLSRTLQTVKYSLGWLLDRGVQVVARAEWQEDTANPCDVGAERSELEKVWPDYDFSQLDPIYPQKTGLYGPAQETILQRAAFARQWLSEQPDKVIVVVTHSGFLNRVVQGPRYTNVEYRAYEIEKSDSGEVTLVELPALSKDIPAKE